MSDFVKEMDVAELSNDDSANGVLSEISRYKKASEPVQRKADTILSTLHDIDVRQAKEALSIVGSYLFRVGEQSQTGVML